MKFIVWSALSLCLACGTWAEDKPPVIYLPFDRDLQDHGVYGFPTTNFGDEVAINTGIKGDGLFVGGTEDWLDVLVDSRLKLADGATLEFWFAREDWENPYRGGAGWQTLVHVDGMTLNVTAPGCPSHVPWVIEASVGWTFADAVERVKPVRLSPTNAIVAPKVWHHVALVYNPAAGQTLLYVNGEPVSVKKEVPAVAVKFVNPLRVGTWFKANQAFRGGIDEVRLYDYPRTPEQIKASFDVP